MPIPINAPPESLAHYLTTTLWRERATLHLLVRRKAREPSIDYLKARGVLRVIREGSAEHHSISPVATKRTSPPLPLWAPRPSREG